MAPKELAQGPYVAAKAGVEPTTLRLSHRLNQCATTPPFVGHSPQQNNNGFSIGVDFGAIFEKRHAFISFRLFATFPTKKLGFPSNIYDKSTPVSPTQVFRRPLDIRFDFGCLEKHGS